jgi:hypothetical protein
VSDEEAKLVSDRNKTQDRKKELEKKELEREAFWGLPVPPHWQNKTRGRAAGAGAGAGGSRGMSPCDSSNSNDEEKNAASSPESDERGGRGGRGERGGEPAAGRAARRSGGGVSDLISTINKDLKVAKHFALARSKAAATGSTHRRSSASQQALFNQ